jgi:hypothetical protein
MNRDDIIRMAKEAGDFLTDKHGREDFIFNGYGIERFAALVAEAEREACAKVCDAYDVAEDVCSSDTAEGIALAIRARGQR